MESVEVEATSFLGVVVAAVVTAGAVVFMSVEVLSVVLDSWADVAGGVLGA